MFMATSPSGRIGRIMLDYRGAKAPSLFVGDSVMEKEVVDRAQAIQQRILQLRDSL